jgi:hypothetical protein
MDVVVEGRVGSLVEWWLLLLLLLLLLLRSADRHTTPGGR